jgi:transposase
MPFAGLDVHKREVEAAIIDDNGRILHRERFACTREQLIRFATRRIGPKTAVALEATTNTWAIVDILQPLVKEVVVSNPMRTRAIADAKIKTDKIDALVLAKLLRADFLPHVWCPDEGTKERRALCSRRAGLVQDRTRIKNRIHAILHQRLIAPPVDALFSTKGRAWLEQVSMDERGHDALNSELRLLAQVEKEIEELHTELARNGYEELRIRLLMTLPGVDVAVAQALLAALGDFNRFHDADHAASYLGLVPSTKQSGDHCYHGPITKQGKGKTRWMLVQAAQHIASHPGPIGTFFRRLAQKKNRNVAVVATARKLVTIAWHMLKNNEPYRYAIPDATEKKLFRLRVKATGEKRTTGPRKGTPRPENYGTHERTRAVPSLDDVYERVELPPTAPLPLGEIRMLRDAKLLGYVEKIRSAHRVPKKQKPKTVKNSATHKSEETKTTTPAPRAQQKNAPGSRKNVSPRLTRS